VASWRERAGDAADALLGAPHGEGPGLALPFPRGRQAPSPDPNASYLLLGGDRGDPAVELTGILRGLAAHGAWMRAVVAGLVSADEHQQVAAVGAPVRGNTRLAALMASLIGSPLAVVDLAAPVASGAAALAAERAGLAAAAVTPFRLVEAHDDGMPDLAERFARAVRATTTVTQGEP
jgi:xylulokinase